MPRQSDYRFTFKSASGVTFDVLEFDLEEALSETFVLEVELSSVNPAVDFSEILDQNALLTILRNDEPVRYVHGIVSTFEQGETGFRRTRYHAVIEPTLARANLRSNWRIFQQRNTLEILQTLMSEQGIADYEQQTYLEYLPREYCVQAGETTLQFIHRQSAEEGLFYFIRHSATGHRLIHSDRAYVHGAIEGGPVSYNPNPGGDAPEPALRKFRYTEQVRSASQIQRDYTFKHPQYNQQHVAEGANLDHQGRDYNRFDFPGRYKEDAAGKPMTQTRLLALRRDARVAIAEGDDARLVPGLAFDLEGHPGEEWNRGWRPVRIKHHGKQHVSQEEESADAAEGTHYSYTAELVPDDVEWKPALQPKPRIDGPHIAIVTGPAGEEIHTDQYGRVTVQFPWDRKGRNDEHSSCWIRVAQNWAGATWGHMAIPRIGQEVSGRITNRPLAKGEKIARLFGPGDVTLGTKVGETSAGGAWWWIGKPPTNAKQWREQAAVLDEFNRDGYIVTGHVVGVQGPKAAVGTVSEQVSKKIPGQYLPGGGTQAFFFMNKESAGKLSELGEQVTKTQRPTQWVDELSGITFDFKPTGWKDANAVHGYLRLPGQGTVQTVKLGQREQASKTEETTQ